MITQYLDDLERRIDPETEETLRSEWQNFTSGHVVSPFFSPRRKRKIPAGLQWPSVTVNQAIDDPELMMLQQLSACSAVLASDRGSLLNVRANFGLPPLAIKIALKQGRDLHGLVHCW